MFGMNERVFLKMASLRNEMSELLMYSTSFLIKMVYRVFFLDTAKKCCIKFKVFVSFSFFIVFFLRGRRSVNSPPRVYMHGIR